MVMRNGCELLELHMEIRDGDDGMIIGVSRRSLRYSKWEVGSDGLDVGTIFMIPGMEAQGEPWKGFVVVTCCIRYSKCRCIGSRH